MKTFNMEPVMRILAKNKYVLAVLLLGLALILWPKNGGSETLEHTDADPLEATGVSLEEENSKLAQLLSQISGVGRAEVLLSKEGAVVVCDGAECAAVKLSVTDAVTAYTGFGSDKISVMKMK